MIPTAVNNECNTHNQVSANTIIMFPKMHIPIIHDPLISLLIRRLIGTGRLRSPHTGERTACCAVLGRGKQPLT